MKLKLSKTLIISLAFFTISVAWTIYNSYVPVFLSSLIKSSTVVGIIMTIDNVFGLLFQPYFGKLSDKTNNRFGRRMPYLLIGIPVSAIFFLIIPWYDQLATLIPSKDYSLVFIMVFVILMNLFMSIYRAPAVALMPDVTPTSLRSKANGIIVGVGGLGTVIALSVGGFLFKRGKVFPFMMGAILMLIAVLVLYFFYREPKIPYSADEEQEAGEDTGLFIGKNGKKPAAVLNPSLIFMLLTVFFWFCGFECINTFFTLYCREKFGLNPGDATQMLAPMVLIFILCAFPGGILGGKIGRKRAMMIGNVLVALTFFAIVFIPNFSFTGILLAVSGIGWALINVNAYPAIAQMAPSGQTGRYTGYYYGFTFAASIASPILYGFVADLANSHSWLFLYSALMFIIGFLFMIPVKRESIAK